MGVFYVSGQKDRFTVGRDRSCDLVIDDHVISRCHLVLNSVTHDVASFEVVGTNGAIYCGQKVNKGFSGFLRFGDSVSICGNEIVWVGSASPFCGMFIPVCSERREVDITPIEIEGPPQRSVPEKPSIMLAAGPALTMAIPILLGAGRTVAVLSSVFAALWAVANVLSRAGKRRSEEVRRKNAYLGYLNEIEKTIKVRQKETKDTLDLIYPKVGGYLNRTGNASLIWSGDVSDGMNVRVGRGRIACPFDIDIPKEKFAVVDDSLKDLPSKLRRKYAFLPEAPVLVDITREYIIAFDIRTDIGIQTASAFILQLAAKYAPDRLTIKVDIEDGLEHCLGWAAYLPHYSVSLEENKADECVLVVTDNTEQAYFLASNGCKVLLMTDGSVALPGAVYLNELTKKSRVKFDRIPVELAYSYSSSLACLWQGRSKESEVPEDVSFKDIIDGPLSADQVAKEYSKSDISSDLCAPIGIGEGGRIVTLDIHEKGSGPHGIIAGTTGSGKSELLTTLILSLALKYPPDKLSFFLIDYKGGGMSNLFASLPHLSGSISNLSGAQSKRAMIALESENIRRQKILADAGVNNINDYMANYDKGLFDMPLPHVLIVIDEFAQLRRDEPEFMDSLISLSQVGRSLGMHLILATQKPAGVVDDRIRSNSGFRIALRLVERADSTDVIGTGDAAFIDRCGRAFLQTSLTGQTVSFQCAYAMGRAGYSDDKIRIFDDAFCKKEISLAQGSAGPGGAATWFDAAMSAIDEACMRGNYVSPRPLFLSPLPESVEDDSAFAVFDDPYGQRYDHAVYVPEDMGSVFIVGRGGAGKSNLVYTLIQGLEGKMAVYITDLGGGLLADFKEDSFCGGYTDEDDIENALRLALYIDDVIRKRRRIKSWPFKIVYVLDGYDELTEDPDISEILFRILSNAKSAGVYVIATSTSLPGSRQMRLFDTFLVMGCEDALTVSSILNVSAGTVPYIADLPGRGIGLRFGRALEFQTVRTCRHNGKSPPGSVDAPQYPYVPGTPSVEDLLIAAKVEDGLSGGLPIGYEKRSGKVVFVPVDRTNLVLIAGKPYSGRHRLLFNMSIIAARYHFNTVSVDTYEALLASCRDPDKGKMILIDDIGKILDDFYSCPREQNEEDNIAMFFENPSGEKSELEHPIVFGVIENDARVRFAGRKIYDSMVKHPFVLWVGEGLSECRNFDTSYLGFTQIQKSHMRDRVTILKYDEKTYFGPAIVPSKIIVDNS